MYDARVGELLVLAAGLTWATFDCWQRRRRYSDVVLGILAICLTIGFAALAFYEAGSN
jgi:hypothetical protein